MKKYINPLLRWWWLILLSTLIAGGSSYLSVRQLPPEYEVHASLIVGRSYFTPNPSSGDIYLEQQLASFYATVGSSGSVAEPTMQALGLTALPQYFIRLVPNSPVIEIVVTDTDPGRAQAVANELANQMILNSPSNKSVEDEERQPFINEQLDKLETEIRETEEQITEANQRLAEANSARQIAEIQTLIQAMEEKRIALQANYSALLVNTDEGSVNNLNILQRAGLPSQPVGPNKPLYILIAAAFGFSAATAAAYLIELVDNRLNSDEEITEILNAPVIGKIPNIHAQDRALYTLKNPRSPITDAFRSLRTNIEFLGIDQPIKTLLVTSLNRSNGKTTVSSNLAMIFAQTGKKVILLDADLRLPTLHTSLGVEIEPGVTDACLGRVTVDQAILAIGGCPGESDGDPAGLIENVCIHFLPSGTPPPNPAELLASAHFTSLLADLSKNADLVIVDCPPTFVPDTSVLLNKVDGVLVVIERNETKKRTLEGLKDQIQRSRARILGVIVNRAEAGKKYYPHYNDKPERAKPGLLRLPILRIKFPGQPQAKSKS